MDRSTRSAPRATGRHEGPAARSYTSSYQVLAGPDVLDHLGAELDELVQAAGAPVTARGTWLRAWVDAYQPDEPWAVAVRERTTGRLDAVALLWSRSEDDHEAITPLGRRQSDRGVLPVRSPEAADALAAALVSCLSTRTRPWALRLGQLPARDPVVAGVVRRLDSARSVPGLPIPGVEFGEATTIEPWLGRGLRKQLRKARNRLDADGDEAEVAFTRDAGDVAVLLDEVERTHRSRERDALRTSDLESASGLTFWRNTILQHAENGEVEVAVLRLGGELASYVVSLLDGDSYRVFDGRCATAWARFSPGRLLEAATLERAVGDGRFARVDWMNGCASEKLLAANAVEHTEHLVASSPGLVVDLDVIGSPPTADADTDPTVLKLASGAR